MSKDEVFNSSYALRLNENTKKQFIHHCKVNLRRPHQDVMRELMDAVIESRITITPTEAQKRANEELYK